MSQVSKTRSYSTGSQITAANYNDDRDEVIAGVNSINNSQIADGANIEESKILMSATGHAHAGGTDGEKVKVTNLDVTGLSAGQVVKVNAGGTGLEGGGAGRAFAWGILGTLIVANEQGMKYPCPQSMTVNKLWAKTDSGTCTIRVQRDTTDVATLDVTSTIGSTTTIASATLTAGEMITLDITAISSGVAVYVLMECTQN
jgi:hypothetical protein